MDRSEEHVAAVMVFARSPLVYAYLVPIRDVAVQSISTQNCCGYEKVDLHHGRNFEKVSS